MSQFNLFDSVCLTETIASATGISAPKGTLGSIVEVLNNGEAYRVELFGRWVKADADGQFVPSDRDDPQAFIETIGVETVAPQQLQLAKALPEDLLAILTDLPEDSLRAVQDYAEFLRQK